MAKVSFYLDKRSSVDNNKHPLKLSIAHRGTNSFYALGITLAPEQWQAPTPDSDGYVKKNCKDYKVLNGRIQHIQNLFIEQINLLQQRQQLYPFKNATQLKNYIVSIVEGRGQSTVMTYFKQVIKSRENVGTKNLFTETYIKLNGFLKGSDIMFEHITPTWLERFSRYIGGSVNYRSIHLRNLRTVFNQAIRDDITSLGAYPFYKFKIKKEETAKRSLTIDQLCEIADMQLPDYLVRYRDLFMLSFYLMGINMADLLHLTAKNIQNGRLIYRRRKTGKLYDLKLQEEALTIINKYRGKKYLLNFLDKSNYESFFSRFNKSLKTLGEETIVSNRGKKVKSDKYSFLSSYYARHTWATIAASLDIPKETIAAALGHEIGNTVTSIYINFDNQKVDDANRRVLDYLLEKRKTV